MSDNSLKNKTKTEKVTENKKVSQEGGNSSPIKPLRIFYYSASVFGILILIAALALAVWNAFRLNHMQLAKGLLATSTETSIKNIDDRLNHLTEAWRRFAEQQENQWAEWKKKEASFLDENKHTRAIVAADDFIQFADRQLQMGASIPRVINVLKLAKRQLDKVNTEFAISLKNAIDKDIARLSSLPQTDKVNILQEIDRVEKAVQTFELPHLPASQLSVSTEKDHEGSDPSWWLSLKHNLSQLFVIHRVDSHDAPLLSQMQLNALKAGIQLKLYQAQWALLINQPEFYKQNLEAAIQLISRYANHQSGSPMMIDRLQALVKVPMVREKPNLISLAMSHQLFDSQIKEKASLGKTE